MIQFDLKNRVAIITGGAQGFGFSIAERFIQSGAKVIMWDIDEDAAKKAKENVNKESPITTGTKIALTLSPKRCIWGSSCCAFFTNSIILAKTEVGAADGLTEADEIKMLQRLVKMRKDSYEIFTAQNRLDLAEPELAQIAVIEKFLPAQMSEEEIKKVVQEIIAQVGAAGPQDLGKVMGVASKQLAGKADGKVISAITKELLTN